MNTTFPIECFPITIVFCLLKDENIHNLVKFLVAFSTFCCPFEQNGCIIST